LLLRALFCILPCFAVVSALSAQPLISPGGIVNSASFAPPLSPGGAIAQGSIFSIFGSKLGPATGVQPSAFPLGTALGGSSVKVIQGNTSVDAVPLYASDGLINAIMPSNAPTGKVSVQVTYGGTKSNLAPVQVAVSAPGIYTATGGGIGPGILQNFVATGVPPINSASATATPGQIMILWLTGLGPIKGPDNAAPPTGTLPFPVEVWVGGKSVTNIAYAGRTPCCAGVDEIAFTLPANVPAGCFVPVTVRVGGTAVSNTVTMAIDGQGAACSDAGNPFSAPLTQGKKVGVVSLVRQTRHSDSGTVTDLTADRATGAFVTASGSGFIFNAAVAVPPPGSCSVYSGVGDYTSGAAPFAFPTSVLDAGSLTLTGPAGNQSFAQTTVGSVTYYATPSGESSSLASFTAGAPALYLNAGTFKITGAGGADVGAFTASVTVPGSGITWTNRDQITTVDRTQPLTVNWSGTGAVTVEGVSYDAPTNTSTEFQCQAPAGSTSFTVPAWILANLPFSKIASPSSQALIGISSVSAPVPFTASGLDSGAVVVVSGQEKFVTLK
jgi:uncharacterized protein (TIGR03437 family)